MNKEKSLVEKINELNKSTNGSLCIDYFTDWEIHSYWEGSLFYDSDKYIHAKTFTGVINKAYRMLEKARRNNER